jgi:hypothetical protein
MSSAAEKAKRRERDARRRARGDNPYELFVLPVSTYREAALFLRRPFNPEAVRFRVWEAWAAEESKTLTHATVVPYIDARTAMARLNLVCPDIWHEEPVSREGGHLWCALTITEPGRGTDDGGWTHERVITRRDIGDTYNGKGLVSDAFKRAAVHFGVGESLYAVPTIEIDTGNDTDARGPLLREWAEWQDGKLKDTLELTRAGEEYARDIYRRWLLAYGIAAFGRPLDHGNLTAESETPITGPPTPTAAKRKAPDRPTARMVGERAGVPSDTITPDATPEDKLEVLLKVKGDGDQARILRAACNGMMTRRGADAAFRLDELLKAGQDRDGPDAGLKKLLHRWDNVPDADVGTSEP